MNLANLFPVKKKILKANHRERIEILFQKDKVVKTVYCVKQHLANYMEVLLTHLVVHPHPDMVRVSLYLPRPSPYYDYPFGYTYAMDRLLPLSKEEKRMVYVFSNMDEMMEDDPDFRRRFSIKKHVEIYEKLKSEYTDLYQMLCRVGRDYHDLHEENVMKTKSGQYQVIDLETYVHFGVDGSMILPQGVST